MQSLRQSSRLARNSIALARRHAATATESAPAAAEAGAASDGAESGKVAGKAGGVRHLKTKNLGELATYLPENGLGAKFYRKMWVQKGNENSYWTIVRVEPSKEREGLTFFGRLNWCGKQYEDERKVQGQTIRGWRYVREQ